MIKNKKIYAIKDIFTPILPAQYTFIERQTVIKRLNRAFDTPGKQIILYGFSGAGKTTVLANKVRVSKIKCVTTRCVTGMTLHDLVLDAFNQLEVYYVATSEETLNGKIGGSIGASYFGIKASISAENSGGIKNSSKRAVDLPITPQSLAKYIGSSGNCWVIEDFHKIDVHEKTLMAQIMKVFMDSSVDYENLRIIAIGAVNSAREVVQFDPEMKTRISEIEVPLMKEVDLRDIVLVGQRLLNIKIPESIINKIVAYSCGLAGVTHQLASLICEENKISKTYNSLKAFEIHPSTFDSALDEYLAENSDTYKSIFEVATRIIHQRKSENPAEILKAILSIQKDSVTVNEVLNNIRLVDKNYKGNNLKKYLDELTLPNRSEILRYNKDSMTYYFSNPFIKAYFQCILRNDIKNEVVNTKILLKEFRETLDKELEIARAAFLRDFEEYEKLEETLNENGY